MKQVLNLVGLHIVRIQKVSVSSSNYDLPGDGDLVMSLISNWAARFVLIVENDRNTCLCNARLSLLVYQLRKISNPDL